jgi:uncharacterized membrane protein YkgB
MKKSTISSSHPASTLSGETTLTKIAAWVSAKNIPFLIIAIGMIVMLFWAVAFKMTAPGAEGIVALASNSPLVGWDYKVFGPYIGADLIGVTEWIAGVLILTGIFKPNAGIVGGIIAAIIFFTTSTMLLTTPGAIIEVKGMGYMNNLGLFLYKDIINLGASFYLISYFGKKAIVGKSSQSVD